MDPALHNNPDCKDLRMEAEKFMAAQPQVMALFTKFALEMAATGNRFGAKLIAERVRWEVATTWAADERGFKLNNNHTAYIARALIEKHQSLEGLMTCRRTVY